MKKNATRIMILSSLFFFSMVAKTEMTLLDAGQEITFINYSHIKTTDHRMIEIRSYNLKPGSRNAFHELFIRDCLPLLNKWKIKVLDFGPSIHDADSYYLIRIYKDLNDMQQSEDAFYSSDDWKQGPREAILAHILNYTTVVLPDWTAANLATKINYMEHVSTLKTDSTQLSALNAQFIKNFLNQDIVAHDKIIHKDFVCIQSSGAIVHRDEYLKNWATGFEKSGYTSFSYTDESIRIFGNMALVRSKTVYTKVVNGKPVNGNTIYTDTYVKVNDEWKCVQAQLTPVKNN